MTDELRQRLWLALAYWLSGSTISHETYWTNGIHIRYARACGEAFEVVYDDSYTDTTDQRVRLTIVGAQS